MTSINSDIIYSDISDSDEVFQPLSFYQKARVTSLMFQEGIKPETMVVSDEKMLVVLQELLKEKVFEEFKPTLMYQEVMMVIPTAYQTKHYYFVCDDTGAIIDFFAWRLESPIDYKDSTKMKRYEPKQMTTETGAGVRSNPFDKNYYYSDTTPIVLWMSVRAIFFGNEEKRSDETRRDFINRLYRKQKRDFNLSRKDALGKMYAIAISSLQKKGYLEEGSRFATKAGRIRGLEYAEFLGQRKFDSHFKDFEEIVRLSRGLGK